MLSPIESIQWQTQTHTKTVFQIFRMTEFKLVVFLNIKFLVSWLQIVFVRNYSIWNNNICTFCAPSWVCLFTSKSCTGTCFLFIYYVKFLNILCVHTHTHTHNYFGSRHFKKKKNMYHTFKACFCSFCLLLFFLCLKISWN